MDSATIETFKDLSGIAIAFGLALYSIRWLASKYDKLLTDERARTDLLLSNERARNDKALEMLVGFDKSTAEYRLQTANALKTISDGIVDIKKTLGGKDG